MPTLVWVHRSQIVACAHAAAAAKRDGNNAASAAAVPDPDGGSAGKAAPVVSASADHAAPPGRKRKCAEAATTAGKKKSKAASAERDLPRGVYRTKSGKFHTRLQWGDKQRPIGMVDTSEQASAARMSVRKYHLDDANVAPCGASEVDLDAVFDAAKTKALESVSGYVTRDLPRGVSKSKSGKFEAKIRWNGQHRYVGSFDTPEQASCAYMSIIKEIGDANLSALGVDEVQAMFDAAKKKALESVGVAKKRRLPKGVCQVYLSGKFRTDIWWGNKQRCVGYFDTPEQASAAYVLVRNDLDDGKLSELGPDEVNAAFDAAKEKAIDAVVPKKNKRKVTSLRGHPLGFTQNATGKFVSQMDWGGKNRYIQGGKQPRQRRSEIYLQLQSADKFGWSKRDLPTGVCKIPCSKKYRSDIWWGNKQRCVGYFYTPEEAFAARMSMMKDLDDANLWALGADKVDAAFDAAKQKAGNAYT